jgi:hypothetical protein
VEVLAAVRGAKTKAQKSLRWPVAKLEIAGPRPRGRRWSRCCSDVLAAGNVDPAVVEIVDGPEPEGTRFTVTVEFADSAE